MISKDRSHTAQNARCQSKSSPLGAARESAKKTGRSHARK